MAPKTTKRVTVDAAEVILGRYFPVLDHGFISLVDYMGSDETIERAARLSYSGGGTRKLTQTRGLIRYLRRHEHTTPTEMVEMMFHVSMPIFVARQWVRHRMSSLNEVSGRYSLLPMIFYTPKPEHFGSQSKANKQGRDAPVEQTKHGAAVAEWNTMRAKARGLYEDLAADGVARELCRIDLPLSTYTQWYWKIDLHNLMRFLGLRCDEHAQWEIRQYANIVLGMVKRLAPLSYQAFIDYNLMSARFSRVEMGLIQEMISAHRDSGEVRGNGDAWSTYDGLVARFGSKREANEFLAKLFKKYERPGFDVSESDAKDPEWFESKMRIATPVIDSKPKGTPE